MTHKSTKEQLPLRLRVSLGSAIVLGLLEGRLDASPTTAYLMTYRNGRCTANCGFCPQARASSGRADMLARVSWPDFFTSHVLEKLQASVMKGLIKRVCVQALNYPQVFAHIVALSKEVHQKAKVPISVSCQPLKEENIRLLASAGVERIGIPLDAATEAVFDKVKGKEARGPYTWKKQFKLLEEAIAVFGKGKVSTHLISGLGETEKEMVCTIQKLVDLGVLPALFAFTPISGTALEKRAQPSLASYRRIQTSRSLIVHGLAKFENMSFDESGRLIDFGVDKQTLLELVQSGEPFLTSGCPACNRPYYNEKPRGPIYNYPRRLTDAEVAEVKRTLGLDEA
ncbi:MAG: radical SAM protein [Candidatus Bathyarchaeia archaeon]